MDSFNWNLGTDDAAEESPNIVPVVQPLQSAAPQVVGDAPQAMTRRELRNRRLAEEQAAIAASRSDAPVAFARPDQGHWEQGRLEQGNLEPIHPESIHFEQVHSEPARTAPVRTAPAPVPVQSQSVQPGTTHSSSARSGSARTARQDRPPRGRVPRKVGGRRKFFSKLFSVGTMVGIAAIMVSTSLPANAFYNSANIPVPAKAASSNSQSMKVASTVTEPMVNRDGYTVSSLLEQLKLKYGSRNFSYTNDINGTIQWPFPVPVPISSGFGPRIAPCSGCSSVHEGIDFTPGRGVAIGAIADGVVSAVVSSHSGYGNHVIVDHVINGQKVQSVYGHMLDNSFTVTVGEQVKVTQKLGEVGSTGESTGPHLHLEIHINGVPVDPFAWLKANAN